MSDEPSESYQEGVEAGLKGKSSSDNPHDVGVLGRIIGAGVGASLGGTVDPVGDADTSASKWEAGRQEGKSLAKDE